MFAARYFANSYFAPRYFPKLGAEIVIASSDLYSVAMQVTRSISQTLYIDRSKERTAQIKRTESITGER